MQIVIKPRSGQSILLEVDPAVSVVIIKEKIEARLGIPLGKQCLVFAGKQLKDDCTFG